MSNSPRPLPEERPVAMMIDGDVQAVLMASPYDLRDFATGFALTEGFVTRVQDIADYSHASLVDGIETRLWLARPAKAEIAQRRRRGLGIMGSGLSGINSLAAALRDLPRFRPQSEPFDMGEARAAMRVLMQQQPMREASQSLHAAGFWRRGQGLLAVREDIGVHNALDKLVGALARSGVERKNGAVVLTSCVSVDLVQKCVIAGLPHLIARAAPTDLAAQTAVASGLHLIAPVPWPAPERPEPAMPDPKISAAIKADEQPARAH